MSSSYRMELDKWLYELDVKSDSVLDIGGAQLPVKRRTKSWDVNEYLIADLYEPHKGLLKPDIIIDLNDSKHGYEGKFDTVFCLEVMEYIWNPFEAFLNISNFMKVESTAWVTFPSIYPLHEPVEDDSLRYMPSGIRKLAVAVGLEIVQMIPRRMETNMWLQTISAERMRASKNADHSISGWIVEFKK